MHGLRVAILHIGMEIIQINLDSNSFCLHQWHCFLLDCFLTLLVRNLSLWMIICSIFLTVFQGTPWFKLQTIAIKSTSAQC